jgi:hypothetical protein
MWKHDNDLVLRRTWKRDGMLGLRRGVLDGGLGGGMLRSRLIVCRSGDLRRLMRFEKLGLGGRVEGRIVVVVDRDVVVVGGVVMQIVIRGIVDVVELHILDECRVPALM